MKLPIDALLPEIAGALSREKYLVIEAPPGAGKTTRVPPALLPMARGEILVLEPRRLAARMAARRVASELGERLGETAGYQVRFEDVSGPRTRIRFVTEGVLTRRLLSDPRLRGFDIVILDEFHERHLDSDLALALLKRIDVRMIVMSATLDAAPIARFLGHCPVLRSEGKRFDLKIEYMPHSAAPLEEQVAAAVERLKRSRWRRAGFSSRSGGNPARGDGRWSGTNLLVVPLPWRSFAGGTGSRGCAGGPAQNHFIDECGGELGHDRGRDGGDRQRSGAGGGGFAVDGIAFARCEANFARPRRRRERDARDGRRRAA